MHQVSQKLYALEMLCAILIFRSIPLEGKYMKDGLK